MNVLQVWLCVASALVVFHHEVSAFTKFRVPLTIDDRAKVLQHELNATKKVAAATVKSGADPKGIFQNCTCDTLQHKNCVCKGLLATDVMASMHMIYDVASQTVKVEVTCNSVTVIAEGGLNPVLETNLCSADMQTCGGHDVHICFRLYHTEQPSDSSLPPQGCNNVEVTIDDGDMAVYARCMPTSSTKPDPVESGPDPKGIFQSCTCETNTHKDCVCSGLIATNVVASMHVTYELDTDTADVVVKCDSTVVVAKGGLNPFNSDKICSDDIHTCGGHNVIICFRLFHMEQPSDPSLPPKGCNNADVTIDNGVTASYEECMPDSTP